MDCPLSLVDILVSVFTVCDITLQCIVLLPIVSVLTSHKLERTCAKLKFIIITALLGWRSRLLHYSLVVNLSIGLFGPYIIINYY